MSFCNYVFDALILFRMIQSNDSRIDAERIDGVIKLKLIVNLDNTSDVQG
jgi:hypothetical protein